MPDIPSDAAIKIAERMVEAAKDWTHEQFASRTVELLIHDEGNLNKYKRTLELVFRVHEAVILGKVGALADKIQKESTDANEHRDRPADAGQPPEGGT